MLARAIVDIELHTGLIALPDAVRFYETHVGMSADVARAEATKNSMFPGTALMYWLGTEGIHDLRRECAAALGKAFSLRRFHDTLLALGAIPIAAARPLVLGQLATTASDETPQ